MSGRPLATGRRTPTCPGCAGRRRDRRARRRSSASRRKGRESTRTSYGTSPRSSKGTRPPWSNHTPRSRRRPAREQKGRCGFLGQGAEVTQVGQVIVRWFGSSSALSAVDIAVGGLVVHPSLNRTSARKACPLGPLAAPRGWFWLTLIDGVAYSCDDLSTRRSPPHGSSALGDRSLDSHDPPRAALRLDAERSRVRSRRPGRVAGGTGREPAHGRERSEP